MGQSAAVPTTNVRRVSERVSVVDIAGEVTAASEDALMDAYVRASGEATRAIVLNFSGLRYMNSGGIGLLVTILVRANRHGQRLLACGLSEHYREILELTRLNEAIGIHDSEAAALATANR
jgi:anti-sigma B factor antagonist